MFKVESYLTPWLVSLLDCYIELKPNDLELSLWQGNAVLKNLQLRLQRITQLLPSKLSLTSGHINELRVHIPWTKLHSESVVFTAHTVEFVLELRRKDVPTTVHIAPPIQPGLFQQLLKRIVNNVNVVIQNLVIKFVHETFILSMTVQTAECYTCDPISWKKCFSDEDEIYRFIEIKDITVYLHHDKKQFLAPILCKNSCQFKIRECSVVNVFFPSLDFSISLDHFPLLTKLFELLFSFTRNDVSVKNNDNSENMCTTETKSPNSSWLGWVWSYIPNVQGFIADENPNINKMEVLQTVTFGIYAENFTIKVLNLTSTVAIPFGFALKTKRSAIEILGNDNFLVLRVGTNGFELSDCNNDFATYHKQIYIKSSAESGNGDDDYLQCSLFSVLPDSLNICHDAHGYYSLFDEETISSRFATMFFDRVLWQNKDNENTVARMFLSKISVVLTASFISRLNVLLSHLYELYSNVNISAQSSSNKLTWTNSPLNNLKGSLRSCSVLFSTDDVFTSRSNNKHGAEDMSQRLNYFDFCFGLIEFQTCTKGISSDTPSLQQNNAVTQMNAKEISMRFNEVTLRMFINSVASHQILSLELMKVIVRVPVPNDCIRKSDYDNIFTITIDVPFLSLLIIPPAFGLLISMFIQWKRISLLSLLRSLQNSFEMSQYSELRDCIHLKIVGVRCSTSKTSLVYTYKLRISEIDSDVVCAPENSRIPLIRSKQETATFESKQLDDFICATMQFPRVKQFIKGHFQFFLSDNLLDFIKTNVSNYRSSTLHESVMTSNGKKVLNLLTFGSEFCEVKIDDGNRLNGFFNFLDNFIIQITLQPVVIEAFSVAMKDSIEIHLKSLNISSQYADNEIFSLHLPIYILPRAPLTGSRTPITLTLQNAAVLYQTINKETEPLMKPVNASFVFKLECADSLILTFKSRIGDVELFLSEMKIYVDNAKPPMMLDVIASITSFRLQLLLKECVASFHAYDVYCVSHVHTSYYDVGLTFSSAGFSSQKEKFREDKFFLTTVACTSYDHSSLLSSFPIEFMVMSTTYYRRVNDLPKFPSYFANLGGASMFLDFRCKISSVSFTISSTLLEIIREISLMLEVFGYDLAASNRNKLRLSVRTSVDIDEVQISIFSLNNPCHGISANLSGLLILPVAVNALRVRYDVKNSAIYAESKRNGLLYRLDSPVRDIQYSVKVSSIKGFALNTEENSSKKSIIFETREIDLIACFPINIRIFCDSTSCYISGCHIEIFTPILIVYLETSIMKTIAKICNEYHFRERMFKSSESSKIPVKHFSLLINNIDMIRGQNFRTSIYRLTYCHSINSTVSKRLILEDIRAIYSGSELITVLHDSKEVTKSFPFMILSFSNNSWKLSIEHNIEVLILTDVISIINELLCTFSLLSPSNVSSMFTLKSKNIVFCYESLALIICNLTGKRSDDKISRFYLKDVLLTVNQNNCIGPFCASFNCCHPFYHIQASSVPIFLKKPLFSLLINALSRLHSFVCTMFLRNEIEPLIIRDSTDFRSDLLRCAEKNDNKINSLEDVLFEENQLTWTYRNTGSLRVCRFTPIPLTEKEVKLSFEYWNPCLAGYQEHAIVSFDNNDSVQEFVFEKFIAARKWRIIILSPSGLSSSILPVAIALDTAWPDKNQLKFQGTFILDKIHLHVRKENVQEYTNSELTTFSSLSSVHELLEGTFANTLMEVQMLNGVKIQCTSRLIAFNHLDYETLVMKPVLLSPVNLRILYNNRRICIDIKDHVSLLIFLSSIKTFCLFLDDSFVAPFKNMLCNVTNEQVSIDRFIVPARSLIPVHFNIDNYSKRNISIIPQSTSLRCFPSKIILEGSVLLKSFLDFPLSLCFYDSDTEFHYVIPNYFYSFQLDVKGISSVSIESEQFSIQKFPLMYGQQLLMYNHISIWVQWLREGEQHFLVLSPPFVIMSFFHKPLNVSTTSDRSKLANYSTPLQFLSFQTVLTFHISTDVFFSVEAEKPVCRNVTFDEIIDFSLSKDTLLSGHSFHVDEEPLITGLPCIFEQRHVFEGIPTILLIVHPIFTIINYTEVSLLFNDASLASNDSLEFPAVPSPLKFSHPDQASHLNTAGMSKVIDLPDIKGSQIIDLSLKESHFRFVVYRPCRNTLNVLPALRVYNETDLPIEMCLYLPSTEKMHFERINSLIGFVHFYPSYDVFHYFLFKIHAQYSKPVKFRLTKTFIESFSIGEMCFYLIHHQDDLCAYHVRINKNPLFFLVNNCKNHLLLRRRAENFSVLIPSNSKVPIGSSSLYSNDFSFSMLPDDKHTNANSAYFYFFFGNSYKIKSWSKLVTLPCVRNRSLSIPFSYHILLCSTSFNHVIADPLLSPLLVQTEKVKGYSFELNFKSISLSFLQDDEKSEIMRITSEMVTLNKTSTSLSVEFRFLQIDNGLFNETQGNFDFPVFLISTSNAFSKFLYSPNQLSFELNSSFALYAEDTFISAVLLYLSKTLPNRTQESYTNESLFFLPDIIISKSKVDLTLRFTRFLAISIHDVSLKLPSLHLRNPSFDQLFEKLLPFLLVSSIKLITACDLIGNPAALVKSLESGLKDLIKCPYQCVQEQGPVGLFSGSLSGIFSFLGYLSSGTLNMLTSFTRSLSRNLHPQMYLRPLPTSLSQGVMLGAEGFGFAILASLAGLCEHPIAEYMRTRSVYNTMYGLGKGLTNMVTTPIGGAADFIYQTGQGLIKSHGLVSFPKSKVQSFTFEVHVLPSINMGPLHGVILILNAIDSERNICHILLTKNSLHIVSFNGAHMIHPVFNVRVIERVLQIYEKHVESSEDSNDFEKAIKKHPIKCSESSCSSQSLSIMSDPSPKNVYMFCDNDINDIDAFVIILNLIKSNVSNVIF